MTQRSQKIWEAFKNELTQEPTDDMREALATSILKIIDEYEEFMGDDSYGRMVVSSEDLRILAYELENL